LTSQPILASPAFRFLPLAGILALVIIACVIRPAIHYRRYGSLGVNLLRSHRLADNVRDLLLIVLFLALLAQATLAALRILPAPQLLVWAGPLHLALQAAGIALLAGGLALFAVAELQMGASWRIGIEEGARPGLVTHGLYAWSRNPIYVGLLTTLAGYAALLPTRLSLVLLMCGAVGLRVQVAAEEAYLLRTYGCDFRCYRARVGRFLPRPAALRRRRTATASTCAETRN
jgi:protein-S-isoprenylcysteine O-methyltransferase Ste14